jgi:peptidoglycan/xylan/chitin deacetylase (PgdA/CDA1 family)
VIEVGAHTITHPFLSRWPVEVQVREVEAGRRACAELTGVEPQGFAYPHGDYDHRTVDVVRRAGFRFACTTSAVAVSASHGEWELPRVAVANWSAQQLARALRTVR